MRPIRFFWCGGEYVAMSPLWSRPEADRAIMIEFAQALVDAAHWRGDSIAGVSKAARRVRLTEVE